MRGATNCKPSPIEATPRTCFSVCRTSQSRFPQFRYIFDLGRIRKRPLSTFHFSPSPSHRHLVGVEVREGAQLYTQPQLWGKHLCQLLIRFWCRSPCLRNPALSQANINGVYIPSALLILGIAILKKEYVPYAVAFAALVGGYKIYAGGACKSIQKSLNPRAYSLTGISYSSIITKSPQARCLPRFFPHQHSKDIPQCRHLPLRPSQTNRHHRPAYRATHVTGSNTQGYRKRGSPLIYTNHFR